MSIDSSDTLNPGELHPMTQNALGYVQAYMTPKLVEAMASSALSGNITATICYGTCKRLQSDEPVSDRYLLGLAWFIKEMQDIESRPTFKEKEV